uniref:RBR-type E3 ubiquitin transferase n=1 Tax=Setaria digitata TaxID=48799 RepID=A0A915PMM0_9BILA
MSLGSDEAMDDDGAFSGGSESDATSTYSDDDGIVVDPPVIKTERGGSHDSESTDFQAFMESSTPLQNLGYCAGRRLKHRVLNAEKVALEMNKIIEDVASVLRLSPTICRLLLHHYKWNKESLLERFYESTDMDSFFLDANIISPFKVQRRGDEGPADVVDTCAICCNRTILTGLQCSHRFCYPCWDSYLTTKIMEEGRAHVACPQHNCPIIVDDEKTLALVRSDNAKKRYRRLIINSFVECNRLLRWCPAADCGHVIEVGHLEARPVKCTCGTVFCFACGHEWHEPVNCRLLKLWIKKCNDDSETSNWISANTKECPKCQAIVFPLTIIYLRLVQVTIEKDGGCNHMTCKNVACKMEFCWMCLGPWEPHGSSWYSCNRFDDTLAKQARDAQERSRAALQRYLHYYNRYMNHQQSLKLEHKLYSIVKSKMEVMQQANMSWIEVQFLRKAVDVLSECRRTLMYTYAFAFYLQKDNQSVIFEENQRDLEHATEQLSEFLERDLDHENLVSLKQKVQDKYRYVEQRRATLLKHCSEGVEHDFWRFTA